VASPVVTEAGPARVFDVEVDDPELASTADVRAPESSEPPTRRVPGVIDRADAARPGADEHDSPVVPNESAASNAAPDGVSSVSAADASRVSAEPGSSTESGRPSRPARNKKSAPLPGETVVERPTGRADSLPTPDVEAPASDEPIDDNRPLAPVVSLFSGSASTTATASTSTTSAAADVPPPPAAPSPPKTTVDDLFAKLRAARTDSVAEAVVVVPEPTHPSHGDAAEPTTQPAEQPQSVPSSRPGRKAPRVPAIFQASPPEPAPAERADATSADDSVFSRREEAIVPLIASASRSLKRVLADEQNDVLTVLRRREPVRLLDALVPASAEHIARYTDAVAAELLEAAVAGAASIASAKRPALEKSVAAGGAVRRAAEMLADQLIDPLRERIDRLVADAGGANADLAASLRELYREWKTRHIDRQVDEAVRVAFGHGALSGVEPGTKICWLVDPSGPACADADDNALGGPVSAGQPFPTDHLCAPAHAGCRCMLTKADR
jgi:hypothetical protein